jgi:hypothetical protein
MHPPIEEWDSTYLQSLAAPGETALLEKKASAKMDPVGDKSGTKDELAKQVCAFANAADGFLIYGIDSTGKLDAGLPVMVNRETLKSWVEGIIPKLTIPAVNNCQARFIHVVGHHATDHGALVIFLPLSEHRPHWVVEKDGTETAYIRVGEHSAPMRLQTFLDISSHGIAPLAKITDIGVLADPDVLPGGLQRYMLNPEICLVNGPLCELWILELSVYKKVGEFREQGGNGRVLESNKLIISGTSPLFPRRRMRAGTATFVFDVFPGGGEGKVTGTLSVESPTPVKQEFPIADFQRSAEEYRSKGAL